MVTENEDRIVKAICNMCLTRCGMDVYVKNGKIVNAVGMQESPFNTLCVKAKAASELAHSEERLTNPLRKINGEFKEVSWDDAFDFIADKLKNIKQTYGAKAVVPHLGVSFVRSSAEKVARRLFDLYGTPNYTSGASFCFLARTIGHNLTCGTHLHPNYTATTRCMVLWGNNPSDSRPLQADYIHAMRGRGAKLIVIDPRATRLAKQADLHAQIRPGTDCALALGLLNTIIHEGWYDRHFVTDWTVGFDELSEHIKDYTPERVEEITWVKAETVREIARIYTGNSPASVSLGISMDHSTNGIQAIRAITTLIAITGNIDVPGGNTYVPRLLQTNLRLLDKVDKDTPVGVDYTIFSQITQEQSVVPAIDQMLTEKPYPIKGLIVAGCNPAVTWPNLNKVRQAFEKLDLLVVIDIFMTNTAKLADIILPGTTFLETEDIRDYIGGISRGGLPLIAKSNRVIEPIGNAMEDWKIWANLGKKMGFEEYFPWKDTEDLLGYLLKDTGISMDQLNRNPGGIFYEQRGYQKYLNDGFNTPSGKVEFYSSKLKEYGYDPLPTFHEPAEGPVSRQDLVENYPLIFLSGPRKVNYLHSQHRNLPTLRKLAPEPLLEMNPQTANRFGIAEGDRVTVESTRGKIIIKARLSEDIHPKIVTMLHGWSDASANYLTEDINRDPISGYPGFRSVMCRITKADT
ncbi:MAG: molybdopterin-dependent oxidoreductase [Deltaproteobacteria bacterium]|nr:molybdopterin-dependent oxidoreductase [Deltaproteobacteria bacterium]